MPLTPIFYVPILKTKAGEKWALSHLEFPAKARLRPLMELHGNNDKSLTEHLDSLCDDLASDWGTGRWLYLDGIWLHGEHGSAATLSAIFATAAEKSLKALPVVRTTFGDLALETVQDIVTENDNNGYLLRITPGDLDHTAAINATVAAIGVPRDRIDLLLDYRHHPMNLVTDVPRVPHLSDWRRFIAASGVFPRTQTGLPINVWTPVPRIDWTSWLSQRSSLTRKPIFSDYTTRSPGAPAEFGVPRVNIRYATNDTWSFHQAGRFADGAAPEMHGLCNQLVVRPEFRGATFSAGDEAYDRVQDPTEGPGGPTQWVQWAVSHHIEFAVEQAVAVGP